VRALLAAALVIGLAGIAPAQDLATKTVVKVRALLPTDSPPTAEAVASGSLDDQLQPFSKAPGHTYWRDYWLKVIPQNPPKVGGTAVVVMNTTRGLSAQLLAYRSGVVVALPLVTRLPGFLGTRDQVYTLPEGVSPAQPLYARVTADSNQEQFLSFSVGELGATLRQGAARVRMIALTFGALMAVSFAALLIGFVLKDRLFILYATMFSLQALYVAYLSGQGFDWPVLAYAMPLDSLAWNVPVALSGAVACLFTREIADLKHFSVRIYRAFGWLALGFVAIAVANLAKFVGFEGLVNDIGDVMFVIAPLFTVAVCFLAWRRGNRAAGWFLIAWCLLEGFTIAAALRFLSTSADSDALYWRRRY
jgi:two-component system, sensor histidine kinase LadS